MAYEYNKLPVEPIRTPAGSNAWDTANPPVTGETTLPPPPITDYYTPPDETSNPQVCRQGQVWDAASQQCVMIDGGGTAPPTCREGREWNESLGTCVDIPGYQQPDSGYNPDQYQRPGDSNVDDILAGGYTPPPTGGDFNQAPTPTMPAPPTVDPYDVSSSPDWMNSPTSTGGVNAVNPNADAFDYGEVGDFSDAAWQNSMRYLEPQMDLQNDRYTQELINQGIDPYSEAGQKAFRQKSMAQNDMLSKSAFDSLGYGSQLQNQMFGQDATRSQLANALLQSQMGLTQRGQEFDTQAGMSANEQAYNQMMGLEGLGYRDYLTGVDQSRYQDTLSLALMGMAPGPSYSTTNTGLSQGPAVEYTNASNYFSDLYSG